MHRVSASRWHRILKNTVPRSAWEIARRNGIGIGTVLQQRASLLRKDRQTLEAELDALETARGDAHYGAC